ncbi:hypothetical protein SUDANB58_01914 [Streptomyces sp. enrichment culture]|uniref:hypothetical protein n=1 Tax=Streptomyces sp. enrichment culture TaxID=1795815 RepID=UPI003F546643
MLLAVAALGIALFALTLWGSVTVFRMQDIPWWRRCLPLALLLVSTLASLLRAFGLPEVANAAAFPFNAAAIVVALMEIRAARQRRGPAEAQHTSG